MLVIKVGGGEGVDLGAVAADVASLRERFPEMVLVHGGSHTTNVVAEKLGHPPEFVTSPSGHVSRRTDRKTLEIFEMVYCGSINKGFVEMLQQAGVNALGLSGIDGRLWEGRRKNAIRILDDGKVRILRDDFTGTIEKVNTQLLRNLIEAGYLPVLTPPAISYEGEAINVDGDRAAAITASALGAKTLTILSNVPGLLREFPDENSLITSIKKEELGSYERFAEGRMKKKVMGAQEALNNGVETVIFADARREMPITRALNGEGTTIR